MYRAFVNEIRRIFKAQELTQARLVRLSNVRQYREVDNTRYMKRVQALVNNHHPKLPFAKRKILTRTNLVRGLSDDTILTQLSCDTRFSITEAVDTESAIAAVLHSNSRSQQSNRRRDCEIGSVLRHCGVL